MEGLLVGGEVNPCPSPHQKKGEVFIKRCYEYMVRGNALPLSPFLKFFDILEKLSNILVGFAVIVVGNSFLFVIFV